MTNHFPSQKPIAQGFLSGKQIVLLQLSNDESLSTHSTSDTVAPTLNETPDARNDEDANLDACSEDGGHGRDSEQDSDGESAHSRDDVWEMYDDPRKSPSSFIGSLQSQSDILPNLTCSPSVTCSP